jgi:hypothetical protein
MQIVKTKAYKISQSKDTSRFILSINHRSINKKYIYEIYKSITKTKILSNAFFYEENEINEENPNAIFFTAENIKPLTTLLKEGKLTNQQTIKMLHDLSNQIAYLEINLLAFYGYELDDILVINDDTFIIASITHLSNIGSDNCIYFTNPIEKPYFSNPELNKLTKLPANINYRSSYYSLGALILFCLTNIYIFAELKEEDNLDDILQPIYYTKMFWFLNRCFYKKSEQRILLFI